MSRRAVRTVGPTTSASRALTPDLARGVMLLLIALAHAPAYLSGRQLGVGGYPVDGSLGDRVVGAVLTDAVVGRAYPMFAALFGYGIVQLLARQIASGATPAAGRRLVRRRGVWLIVLGGAHAALLWGGDILGAYGVVAVVLAGILLRMGGRLVAGTAACSIVVVAVGGATGALLPVGTSSPLPSTGEPDAIAAAWLRVTEWAPSLVLQPLGLAGAVAVGMWAARRRVLEEPWAHGQLLRRTAVIGIGVALLGGLPMALLTASDNVTAADAINLQLAGGLHYAAGYGGIGYAALLGLLVSRSGNRAGVFTLAFAACGQRSLSCYLAQSVLFVALLAPYAGGLGEHIGLVTTTVVGITVWAVTVCAADLMRRHDRRGPAEIVLRHLTYRTSPARRTSPTSPTTTCDNMR